jgi:hypothetical protein
VNSILELDGLFADLMNAATPAVSALPTLINIFFFRVLTYQLRLIITTPMITVSKSEANNQLRHVVPTVGSVCLFSKLPVIAASSFVQP